ncbi:protein of unknown function [Sinomicrobium oceani]|uniref:DUF4260 domain-containing protein n=1 Tax=Sinomicrobium oceani TaxID=1150368 RepID=A0A1K1NDZ2_9FLAO|nr:DUF4260 domain-containing protein [Sinomicrobium oceani]SFW33465.1 protein of unknown function [Sinomicrobium oceani]
MKFSLKLEELAMLVLGIYLFGQTEFSWWWFAGLFLAPDIGMIGYMRNAKTGAFTYNLLHHKGIAIALYLVGVFAQLPVLELIGTVCFAHSGFDRMLGYGLKYGDSFVHTHLGRIGKEHN